MTIRKRRPSTAGSTKTSIRKRGTTNKGFLDHFLKLTYYDTNDSQLQAAQAFHRFSSERSKAEKMLNHGGIEAIIYLIQKKYTPVIVEALKALVNMTTFDAFADALVIKHHIFLILAKSVTHHENEVKMLSAKAIGYLGAHHVSSRRIFKEGALLPLCSAIRPNQHKKVIKTVCWALARLYLNMELIQRIISVWGLHSIIRMITNDATKEQVTILDKAHFSLLTRKFYLQQEKKYNEKHARLKDATLAEYAGQTIYHFLSNHTLAQLMVEKYDMLKIISYMLLSSCVPLRVIGAKSFYRLVEHHVKEITKAVLKHPTLMQLLFSKSMDPDFNVKHQIARGLNMLMESQDANVVQQMNSLTQKCIGYPFLDWILRATNCSKIQMALLNALIQSAMEDKKALTSIFDGVSVDEIGVLVDFWENAIDTQVKLYIQKLLFMLTLCGSRYRKILLEQTSLADLLVKMITHRHVEANALALKTLCQLAKVSPHTSYHYFKSPGIETKLLAKFKTEKDLFHNYGLIHLVLYTLEQSNDFRIQFFSNGYVGNMAIILDRHSDQGLLKNLQVTNQMLSILNIFISSANKEGSGNAYLKFLNEKRLIKLMSLMDSALSYEKPPKSLSFAEKHSVFASIVTSMSLVQAPTKPNDKSAQYKTLFSKLIQCIEHLMMHTNFPMGTVKVWAILVPKLIQWLTSDYVKHLDRRAIIWQTVTKLLQRKRLHSYLPLDEQLLPMLLTCYQTMPRLLPLRQSMALFLHKTLSSSTSPLAKKLIRLLETKNEYTKGMDIASTSEVVPSYIASLKHFLDNYDNMVAVQQDESKARLQLATKKLKDNAYNLPNETPVDDDDQKDSPRTRFHKLATSSQLAETANPPKKKYALLDEWKKKFDETAFTGTTPQLHDVPPQTYRMKGLKSVSKYPDLDPKVVARIERRSVELGLMMSQDEMLANQKRRAARHNIQF